MMNAGAKGSKKKSQKKITQTADSSSNLGAKGKSQGKGITSASGEKATKKSKDVSDL